ncbi:MAG TPA: NB-ARC domain-containing protein, partial [Micromonosporaceae bacterium]|nr:NB-ARC domain-containing protein [Micromonosporaceae bacterium]
MQDEPFEAFRASVAQVYREVRRPTYRALVTQAELAGAVLHTSTIGDLLNGPRTPRWVTVEAFLRACERYAEAHRIATPAGRFDLDRWHADYRAAEAAQAERAGSSRPAAGGRGTRSVVVPAQLPADLPAFAGRSAELAALDRLLASAGTSAGTAAPVVVSGGAGVGKTALAVHWAHRVAPRFPDGQLYVNLRGFGAGAAMDPGEAVRGFLDVLQVDPARIPARVDAQAALYRSLLAGRRMLVVLDDARDSDQVHHLLPGAPGCFVVITSRTTLTGLVAASGAHPLTVDRLTDDEARELLSGRLGGGRVAAEPRAVDELVTACAHLPLALSIVAAHAVTRPRTGLSALAVDLADPRRRLDVLTSDSAHTDVRRVFSWSYHSVSEPAARLFRCLGLHHGVDVTVATAASLAGVAPQRAARLLDELADTSLVVEHGPGRYDMHDLLRVYAAELADVADPPERREAATNRILDHHVHTAGAATRLLGRSCGDPVVLGRPAPGVTPETLDDQKAAKAWFEAEHRNVLVLVDHALATGRLTRACQLAWNVFDFLDRRGRWHDWLALGHRLVAAVGRSDDPAVRSRAHRLLANAYLRFDRIDEGLEQLEQALPLDRDAGNPLGQAAVQMTLSAVRTGQDRHADGLAHARRARELYRGAGDADG